MNAAAALMTVLQSAGVRYLFGNPGTTELPFLDALDGAKLHYVVGLQEATVVAAADGYAQATGEVGVANVHVAPGLANALSILHNAARSRSPVVLTAGQQDTRLLPHEPILAGDLVQMAEPFTKWAYEIRRADEAVTALRRAITIALTPPTGPVFLSLPMDLMTEEIDTPASPARDDAWIPRPGAPVAADVARASSLLAGARAPMIVAGDGVGRARDGVATLTRLAEVLGARVYGEPIYRRTNFPGDHPLWRGGLYPSAPAVSKALDDADVVLIVGADVFTWFLHGPGGPFRSGVPVIQIADDPRQVGRSYPVDLAFTTAITPTLRLIADELAVRLTNAQRAGAAERLAQLERVRADFVTRARGAAAEAERVPISPAYLMHTLAGLLPDGAVIVDESASSLPHVLRHLSFTTPGSFYGSKTGTLGWAMGAAIGVQLAEPRRKVVVTIGDGSVMYAPQALWTAAHERLPITYVVANNASYAILKAGMATLGLAGAKKGFYPGMDLTAPEVDYVRLAGSLGVRAVSVEKPRELRDALAESLAHPGPALLDVAIDRSVKGGV